MQKVILQGTIGKEIKQVTFGERTQLNFSLACTNRDKDKTTTWYNILSDNMRIEQWLKPGKPIIVTGDLMVKTSQGKDGKTYVNVNVNHAEINFLPLSKPDGATTHPQQVVQQQVVQPQPQQNPTIFVGGNDGLPF